LHKEKNTLNEDLHQGTVISSKTEVSYAASPPLSVSGILQKLSFLQRGTVNLHEEKNTLNEDLHQGTVISSKTEVSWAASTPLPFSGILQKLSFLQRGTVKLHEEKSYLCRESASRYGNFNKHDGLLQSFDSLPL